MSNLIVVNWPAPSTTAVAPAQTAATLGYLSLNTYINDPAFVVFPNMQRTISFTSAANLSGIQFEIIGTDFFGNYYAPEVVSGPNATTVYSTNQYHKIYSIQALGSTGVNTVSVGTGPDSAIQPIGMDGNRQFFQASIQAVVTGSVTYSMTQTLDAPETSQNGQSIVNNITLFPINATLTGATTNQLYYLQNPVSALQLSVDNTSTGSLTLTILQQGMW
jgi:hypothetical protein